MSNNNASEIVTKLFKDQYGEEPTTIEALAPTGSYRQYLRLKSVNNEALGVYNIDSQENEAYISFTNTFCAKGIQVPKIIKTSEDQLSYLVEDMGTEALWDYAKKDLTENRKLTPKTIRLFEKSLLELYKIQTKTIEDLDLSFCYPRDTFDKQSMLWDLNYFKYMFLRVLRVAVDEQALENDIQALASNLDKIPQIFFLFRDFQSRNIVINGEKPYFIDFQGGRKGAIYYDLASLLYDANIQLPEEDKEALLQYYYNIVEREENYAGFKETFEQFAIIRLTQALGAFGLRGVIEKKPHFKECIPFALKSLQTIFSNQNTANTYPCLKKAVNDAAASEYISTIVQEGY